MYCAYCANVIYRLQTFSRKSPHGLFEGIEANINAFLFSFNQHQCTLNLVSFALKSGFNGLQIFLASG